MASRALTDTELAVARLIADGRTVREISDALGVAPKTVEWHRARIYRKLGIATRGDLSAALRPPVGPGGPEDGPNGPLPPSSRAPDDQDETAARRG